jgi:hypothetical protein
MKTLLLIIVTLLTLLTGCSEADVATMEIKYEDWRTVIEAKKDSIRNSPVNSSSSSKWRKVSDDELLEIFNIDTLR